MSPILFNHLSAGAPLIRAGAYLGGGMLLGLIFFRGLWWNVRQFAGGRALSAMLLMTGRFSLMAAVLLLTSLEGARPLLTMALGVLGARAMVLRRSAKMMP